jgi:hypothetical protein
VRPECSLAFRACSQDAAVRAERWAWVAVTRKKGELKTYVNGRLCAEIKLDSSKLLDKSKLKPAGTARAAEEGVEKEVEKEGKGGGGGKGGKDGAQHGAPPPERFCLDPQHVALFAARGGAVLGAASSGGASSSAVSSAFASSAATAGGAAGGVSTGLAQHGASLMSAALLSGGEDGGSERGLAVRYVKLVSSVWTEEQVCEELHRLRGKHQALHACKCSPRRPPPTGTRGASQPARKG